jgi:hypothetical protein
VAVRRHARGLVAPALIAASLAAFVVTGMHSETLSPTPSKARAPNPNIDTRTGCQHLLEGCTIGRRPNTGQVVITEFRERP